MTPEMMIGLLDKYGIPLVIIAVLLIGITKLFKWHDRRENERMRQHAAEREAQSRRHGEEIARAYDQFQKALVVIADEMHRQGEALTGVVITLTAQQHDIKEIRTALHDMTARR